MKTQRLNRLVRKHAASVVRYDGVWMSGRCGRGHVRPRQGLVSNGGRRQAQAVIAAFARGGDVRPPF